MTGFGRGSAVRGGLGIDVEIRSVNHRYADFILRLPREFYPLEDQIRSRLKNRVERGRLEVTVTLEEPPAAIPEVQIDYPLADELCRVLTLLSRRLTLDLDVNSLFAGLLPEIITIKHPEFDEKLLGEILGAALDQALEGLVEQRRREGAVLAEDLTARCLRLEELVEEISRRAPLVYEDYRLRLEERLREELKPGLFDEDRVLMECALLVEKGGIDEELVRLRSHLQAFRRTLKEPGAVGRKLDFIAQEMFRESNTIGAKSIDSQLTGLVVEVKTGLEKIREQIQNIE